MFSKKAELSSTKKINRICFLNPQGYVSYPPPLGKTDTGGQTIYILQLAHALGKKGIKVDIFTRQFENQPEEESPWENVHIVRIPCGSNKFENKEKMYELMPEFVDNIMEYIDRKSKKYSVIHSHYWDGGYAGILLAKLLDIPHVHTPHMSAKAKKFEMSIEDIPVQKLKSAYRYHVRVAVEQKILNRANAVVVICETSRIQLLHYYTIDFEKIHVIYPGIDAEFYNKQRVEFDKKVKLKPNSILSMARLVPSKGVDRILDALNLIKDKVDFHYYSGGDITRTDLASEELETITLLKKLITKYKLSERVTFIGQTDHDLQLPAYFRAADIFILPSRFETFGLTTLEAMACGTIPLVSHTAGSREIVIDGLNGFIVDTHDRKALAELILKLLTDAKLRKKISENAAFTIQQHYSWDKIVERFITLYKKLI